MDKYRQLTSEEFADATVGYYKTVCERIETMEELKDNFAVIWNGLAEYPEQQKAAKSIYDEFKKKIIKNNKR